jgi:hypothetical protein
MFGFLKKLFGNRDDEGPRYDRDGRPIKRDLRGEITVDYEQIEREDPVYYTIKGRKTVKLHLTPEIKDGQTVRFRNVDGNGNDLLLKINLTGRAKRPDQDVPDYLKPPSRRG